MPFVTRKSLLTLSLLSGVAVLAAAGFIWSGVYNVGADDQHTRPVYAVMEALRERSIQARASKLEVPDLADPARITQGAGNYNAMCMGCHLAPGMPETELSKGLYPAPPNLTRTAVDAAEAFWVIKHGIKASGMPAWGKSMDDEYIWNMAAFLQQLPKLDANQYQAMVASSGGHSHGGGETKPHEHADGEADDHGDTADIPMGDEGKPHAHAPGTPPHDDGADKAPASSGQAKPHSHAPGTPPHDDGAAPTANNPTSSPAKPVTGDEHAGMAMPEPAPAEHDDDHQH
jgi:mono/diheme cytochrome c family protein